jgi:hypothetical protein
MVETAGTIVRDALSELTVQADEQTLPAVELNTGIRFLNRMMAALDADGVKLGYTFVDAPNDPVTVPAGAVEGMVYNLAVRLATGYDIPISASLANNAREGLRVMETLGVNVGKVAFPSTLPIGSGNEYSVGSYPNDPFYPSCCEDVNPCGNSGGGDSNGM